MAEVTLTLEEYEALRGMAHDNSCINCSGEINVLEHVSQEKPKKKPSTYNIKFSKAFKKFEGEFKKKNGSWMKDGFKRTAAKARKSIK